MDIENIFKEVGEKMISDYPDVDFGKMMSSPAITFKGKVIAFYYKDLMVFRLGKDFDLGKYGITKFNYLNPFKNKPPMKGWYEISVEDKDKWFELAEEALNLMKS